MKLKILTVALRALTAVLLEEIVALDYFSVKSHINIG
jgi:hypothetical protein